MARGRMISKSLSTSEKFAGLSQAAPLGEFCQVLYLMLIPHSDDFGRLQGDPFTVKHQCLPASLRSLEEFHAALNTLHQTELIHWYQVSGKRFIQICNFDPHQSGLHKRTKSSFPGNSRKFPEIPSEEKRTEEKRREGKKNVSSAASAEPPSSSPAVLEFLTVGTHGGSWTLTTAQVTEWSALFPGLDILAEAKHALAWVQADPRRRKTSKGMPRFLVAWFTRSVDRGQASASKIGAPKTAGNDAALASFVARHQGKP